MDEARLRLFADFLEVIGGHPWGEGELRELVDPQKGIITGYEDLLKDLAAIRQSELPALYGGDGRRDFASQGAAAHGAVSSDRRSADHPPSPLAGETLVTLLQSLSRGVVSPLEVLDSYLSRAEAENSRSKAFIRFCPERAEREFAGASPEAPLFGVPYCAKDLFETADGPTTCGSHAWADHRGEGDAAMIQRLSSLGAGLFGKNNLHEFAYGATGVNEHYGTVPNPYNPTRLAGGSSSGSAYAVARGLAPFALGTDTGGSVRAPAALCGVVGFKPSFARLSTQGVVPYCWSLDHVGLFTRTAQDCALLFALLDGASGAPREVLRDFLPGDKGLAGVRVGVPEVFFFDNCDPEILESVKTVLASVERAGATIKPVSLPDLALSRSASLTVQMTEALSFHRPYLETRGALYSEAFRAGLALGQFLTAEHYVNARRLVERYRLEVAAAMAEVDCLLTPTCPVVAPKIGLDYLEETGIREPVGNAITRYTSFFNMTGQPAISLPLGRHSAGLPFGMQLVGRQGDDLALLRAACALEAEGLIEKPEGVNWEA